MSWTPEIYANRCPDTNPPVRQYVTEKTKYMSDNLNRYTHKHSTPEYIDAMFRKYARKTLNKGNQIYC